MKARILVVDDEPAIRDTMRMILEYDGHEVLTAGSGPEALSIAERESPDLAFLDIKMPGIDGLEVLSRLRGTNETLPVVIVSAHGPRVDDGDRRRRLVHYRTDRISSRPTGRPVPG